MRVGAPVFHWCILNTKDCNSEGKGVHKLCIEGLGGANPVCHAKHPGTALQAARAEAKDIVFDQDSRRRMQNGINKLADAVGVTLGPRGELHGQQRVLLPDA